jgi:WhiB family redox-sensing transcriptional regulator
MLTVAAEPWFEFAVCRHTDPNVFFPSDSTGVRAARDICESCPAQEACLEYALVHRIDHGIWGGTSERARRRMLKRRRVA